LKQYGRAFSIRVAAVTAMLIFTPEDRSPSSFSLLPEPVLPGRCTVFYWCLAVRVIKAIWALVASMVENKLTHYPSNGTWQNRPGVMIG
jgi:hypothetical protein